MPHLADVAVLLIEDDPSVQHLLQRALAGAGAATVAAAGVASGMRAVYQWRPDVIVLDLGLPDGSGMQTLERIRSIAPIPVLVLTADSDQERKLAAFDRGADDYMTKPFDSRELIARLGAIARRGASARQATDNHYSDGRLSVDFDTLEVRGNGEQLSLTPLEFRLLSAFVRNGHRVLSPEQLLTLAWPEDACSAQRVRVTLAQLRNKLARAGNPDRIETVRGFGYRWRSR